MRAVLMCQGEQSRMQDALGCPKHLVDIAGKPLLARTIALVDEMGFDPVIVAPATEVWTKFAAEVGVQLFTQRIPGFTFVDALKNTRHLWGADTSWPSLVLNGDVLFSPEALAALVYGLDDAPLSFLARFAVNVLTGRDSEEIYGFAASARGVGLLDVLLEGDEPKMSPYHTAENLWHMLHFFQDRREAALVPVPWDDYTDDVDKPEDVELLRKYVAPRLP